VVLEPVAGDHGERDQEGEELLAHRVVERAHARPRRREVADLEARDEQRQREGVGRVDEADGATELRLVPVVPRLVQQQGSAAAHDPRV
jgi:hypothetical protein